MDQLRLPIPISEDDLDRCAAEVVAPRLNRAIDNLGPWATRQKQGILERLSDRSKSVPSEEFVVTVLCLLTNEMINDEELNSVLSKSTTQKLTTGYWHLAKLYDHEDLDQEYQPVIESIQDMMLAELEDRGYRGEVTGF